MIWVDILFRWAHILPAIALLGGAFFMRFALLPAVDGLSDESRETVEDGVRKRWSKVVMASALFLLVSGFYNIFAASTKYDLPGWYMGIITAKLFLALGILFLSSVLSGRSESAAKYQAKSKMWLSVNLALAITLVCLAGGLRMHPHTPKKSKSTEDESRRVIPVEVPTATALLDAGSN